MKFVAQLVRTHLGRYPEMQLLDIYKLLHQAALGNSHAMGQPKDVLRHLEEEAASMGEGPAEPLWEPISPDGRLVRVHLRPYVAGRYDLETLAAAQIQSPERCPPAPEKLAKFCGCMGDLAAEGVLPFPRQDVVDCFDEIAEQGYPAVRHTKAYREAYKPAYRVVDMELLPPSARAA